MSLNNNEKIKVNNDVKNIFILVKKRNFYDARIMLESLKNKEYSDDINEIIIWISKYICEAEHYHLIEKTDEEGIILKYLKMGKAKLDDKDYKSALEVFLKGESLSNDPLFIYYIAICYYKIEDYSNALKKFHLYKKIGYIKIEECYEYLIKIYTKLVEIKDNESSNNLSKTRKKQYNCINEYEEIRKIKLGKIYTVSQVTRDINLDDNEIKELLKNGKVNDTIAIFESAPYIRKVTILALLYINGFSKAADKLLKVNRDDLKRECPGEVAKLNLNMKLYKEKAKHGNQ